MSSATQTPSPLKYDVVEQDGNRMVLSMGPQHPSTHGVLQVMLELDGETITKAEPEIGYLHTGIEKTAENLFWTQAQTVVERMDYLAPLSNALAYVLGVEKLLGITDRVPERAQQIRVLFAELTRIASHCVWLGTHGIDLGAISTFFYCFDLRERILDLQEYAGGARMHPNYFRIGGVNGDLPEGFMEKLDGVFELFPPRMREMRALLQKNPILQDRTIDVGILSAEDAVAWGVTGAPLRASGVAYDIRKAFPYSGYEKYAFDIPTRTEGDAYARFLVRLDEMEESYKICMQVKEQLVEGPVLINDAKIAGPPKETIALSMEALIHHFKIVSEGLRVPPGEVYQAVEGPRGELGYYIVSDGGNRPHRVRTRPASLYNLQVLKHIGVGEFLADLVVMIGSLDPVFGEVDRWARWPALPSQFRPIRSFRAFVRGLNLEFQAIIAQYEESRSALLPIIHRFQDEEGYVSHEALTACAEILNLPVSVVESTVSFYTLFFRRPVGKYVLQVCRGLSCTINGAEDIMKYFREQMGVGQTETTDDGLISYEEVECLAACDRAVCMQVNLDFVFDLTKEKIDTMLSAIRAGTFEIPALPQSAKPGRTWHVSQDTGKKSAGAVGVSNPNSPGGVGDRAGSEMLKRIVGELPEVVARSHERLVRDASQTEKQG